MATLDTRIRALWFLNDGDIPTDWSRDDDYNELYLEGDGTVAGVTGGSLTHLHTINDHDHDGDAHEHSTSSGTPSVTNTTFVSGADLQLWSDANHSHGAKDSNSETITYQDATGLSTATASGHDPLFMTVIVIKPDDGNQQLPVDAVALWDSATIPDGHQFTNGDSSSPDLRNRFFKGAVALANGGATGGSADHTHTGVSHTHTVDDHVHDLLTAVGDADNVTSAPPDTGGAALAMLPSHHEITLDNKALADLSSETTLHSATSNEPAFVRLSAIQNQTGGEDLERGMILMFKGGAADVPSDWNVCDGTRGTVDTADKQIKVVNVSGEIGDTGGQTNQEHGHTGPNHTHTHGAHDHASTVSLFGEGSSASGTTVGSRRGNHTHTWTIENVTPTQQSMNPIAINTDVRLPFIGIVFVQYDPPTVHIKGGDILGGHIAA